MARRIERSWFNNWLNMKSKRSDLEVRYLLLFKLDAQNLFNRVVMRQHEYIEAFSLKRNRAVFRDIFENRYSK